MGNENQHSFSLVRIFIFVLIICVGLTFSSTIVAKPTTPIMRYVHVEHNPNSQQANIPEPERFKSLNQKLLSFNQDLTDAYWLQPTLPNGQAIEAGQLFTIKPTSFHDVSLYIPALNGNIPIKSISRFSVNTAPKFSHRAFVFEIPNNYQAGQDVFFYILSRSDTEPVIDYWAHDDYLIVDRKYSGIYSALFASLFILVLINFIFFIAIRDTSYLAYVFYLATFLLFILMTTGKLYEFSSAKWIAGNYNGTLFVYCLTSLALTLFIQRFLNLKVYTPIFYWVTQIYVLIYTGLIIMSVAIWPIPYIGFTIANYLALLSFPFIMYACVRSLLKGHKQAKFFLIAFLPLFLMILIRTLAILNIIPSWEFALAGFQLAVVFQAVVLTVALADQMLELRKERDVAQDISIKATSSLQHQKEFTDFLTKISEKIRDTPNVDHAEMIVSSFFKHLKSLYSIEKGSVIYQVDNELRILSDNDINQAGFEDYVHDHIGEVSHICHGQELKELAVYNHPFFSRFTKMLVIPVHMRGEEWSGLILNIDLTRKLSRSEHDSLHHYSTELVRTLINAHKLNHYSIKAETDDLTQVMNRGAILEQLSKEIDSYQVSQLPLSAAFLDIDHFKQINDTLGHEAGDTCLAYLALQIRRYLPANAHVGRMGGDEFLFVFPNHLAEQTKGILNALSNSLETLFIDDEECSFTLSIGIAEYTSNETELKAFLRVADEALYASKENGRARITIAA